MIYVNLVGHHFNYEINELIKVFFFGEEIVFIDNIDEYTIGILVVNKLIDCSSNIESCIWVYKDGNLIHQSSIKNIEKIKVDKGNIRKKIRIGIKQNFYEALSNIAKVKAPWGILTGIRPVKIVHNLLDEGLEDNEILNILTKEYKLYSQKAELILDIGKEQRQYLYPLDRDRFSLYISIPFCPTRCLYCSFPSLSIKKYEHLVEDYVDKLIYEINRIGELMKNKTISTVYIGGGTPSAISPKYLEKIIQAIYKNFPRGSIQELTVEAGRPDTIDIQMLKMLNRNNVERISINPQTMNDSTLKLIGRQHSSQDIIKTYIMAGEIGFTVINMDLIVGLPSEGVDDIKKTLNKIKELDPENLTVHTLSVKRGSKFIRTMDKYQVKDQNIIEKMLNETKNFAVEMNLLPYYLYRQKQIMGNFENIGYAKKGKECIYNIKMMEEKETIIGLGMGAVSKIYFPKEDRIKRVPNVKSLEEYLKRVEEMVERKARILS
ncbi:coproporphyrinogen dehydrogenase HemZ [Schnuerera sp.]|uniref:coproporphyrinogen dehydrogenase HemZ n=1 Tax=Schnuerera sp. TaxID=2794844 RepID=UPI002BB02AD4|nr:coproporphyrinogen dehydrogenase HemZ [Schnuerera sp.]HSH35804.1 coproporphyrinogen dehydrogenase HemZ [Schnuerera sp.]